MFRHEFQKIGLGKFPSVLLLMLVVASALPLYAASADPWNPGGPTHLYLTPKWAGYVAGGGLALVTADVLSEYGGEEVFHAGGPAQPSSTPGRVTCLSGTTGAVIWTTSIYCIGDTATLQLADVNHDGRFEIIVTLQDPAGLYILNAENGSTLWCPNGTYNGHTGFITPVGGRLEANSVVGDTDGDGYPDIFVGVMAYEEQPNTGKIIHYEWDPTLGTVIERGRIRVWHPCAGGLSLADTDHDGVFELYVNERHPFADDGGWGRGLISYWAENLTMRWACYDWEASSEIPMLADVDKDGVLDIVSSNLYTGICVLNSTDGRPLRNSNGTVLYNPWLGVIHNHYQASIYDIDGDGNLELLCADGTFDHNGTQVWDLWSWKLDADIPAGYSFRGPDIGDVTGDGKMDTIIVTFDPSGDKNGTVQIYNQSYQLVDSFSGLAHRAIGSVAQDIDQDGLNELIVFTQGGIIYCFDTPGLSQESLGLPRARSEVYFYSESRLGVSEYVPYENPWPNVISPSPALNSANVSDLTHLSFKLRHPLNQTMSYTVTSSPDIGSGSGTIVGNGVVAIPVNGLSSSTTYHWQISVNDTSGHVTNKNYWFTTFPVFGNVAPSQDTPVLGGNMNTENLNCYNQTTLDFEGNRVTNTYSWLKNSVPIANLLLSFDTKPDANAIYSGTALTRDYSGYGNNGVVFGASWTKGIVGGAFSFDGNDFIQVEEQSNSLDGGGSWSGVSVEFWIKATTTGSNWKLIWKPNRYDTYTTPSYEVDFQYSDNQLSFMWGVNTNITGYNTVSYQTTEVAEDWHHVICTYKSGVGLIIYFDGVQAAANLNPAITGNVVHTNGPLEIAYRVGTDPHFSGILDEVKLYPSDVSAAFANQRYLDTKDGLSGKSTIPAADIAVGDVWRCQVTPNDGLADGTTRDSKNILISDSGSLFVDGFESGSFSQWTGTTTTTSSFASVDSDVFSSGSFSGRFTVNAGSSIRRAYSYVDLGGLTELHAYAYVYIADGLPLSNGQNIWLIQFADFSGSAIASFGISNDGSGTKLAVQYYRGAAYAFAASSIPLPSEGQWYLLGAHYIQSSTGKTIILTVNGVEAASLSQDTSSNNMVAFVRYGLAYYTGSSASTVYVDDVTINSDATPHARYILHVQIIGSGAINVTDGTCYYDGTVVAVDAIPKSDWTLGYWLLDDKNTGSTSPCVVTMDSDHSLTMVFLEPDTSLWRIAALLGLAAAVVFIVEVKRHA